MPDQDDAAHLCVPRARRASDAQKSLTCDFISVCSSRGICNTIYDGYTFIINGINNSISALCAQFLHKLFEKNDLECLYLPTNRHPYVCPLVG
jgi:hypothetical protein